MSIDDGHNQSDRRRFLQRAGAGLLGLSLLGIKGDSPQRRVAAEPLPSILPQAKLLLMGGAGGTRGRIEKLIAEQHLDISLDGLERKLEAVYKSEDLPAAQRIRLSSEDREQLKMLSERCFAANVFVGIDTQIAANLPFYNDLPRGKRPPNTSLKGKTAVEITSAATTQENADSNARFDRLYFHLLGAEKVVTITNKDEANSEKAVKAMNEAVWVDFDGGDQSVLMEKFAGTKAFDVLQRRFFTDPKLIVGGESAGDTVMAEHMIADWKESDKTAPEMGKGFGFLQGIIMDSHMNRPDRGHPARVVRLGKAVGLHPECLGLGLEERTGLLFNFQKGIATVVGDREVHEVRADAERNITTKRHQRGAEITIASCMKEYWKHMEIPPEILAIARQNSPVSTNGRTPR
jgi:cyanophycinase